jgi:mono/diheme cytochrome c family protein
VFSNKTELAAMFALPLGIAFTLAGSATASPATAVPVEARLVPVAVDAAPAVSFAEEIMPIFERSCVSCHGEPGEDGEIVVEASLDMTTYEGIMAGSEWGSVIEPGDPGESLLLDMVKVGDMPEDGDPLDPAEIELIETWIAEGAENN